MKMANMANMCVDEASENDVEFLKGLQLKELVPQKSAISLEDDPSIFAKIRMFLDKIPVFHGRNIHLIDFDEMPRLFLIRNMNQLIEFAGSYNLFFCKTKAHGSQPLFVPNHCIWKCEENIYYATLQVIIGEGGMRDITFLIVVDDNMNLLEPFLRKLAKLALEEWEIEHVVEEKALDQVFLPGSQLESIRSEIRDFLNSREFYQNELNLPWKRGIVFYGPPGNGKTLLIRSIAEEFGFPLADFKNSINSHDGSVDLDSLVHFRRNPLIDTYYPEKVKPVLIYLEDLDRIAPKTGAFSPERDLPVTSISNILNAIDGVHQVSDGCLFIATVNDARDLSDALMDRPGRFDSLYEIGYPDIETVIRFWKAREFSICIDDRDVNSTYAKKFVENEMSMAFAEEFIKACVMKFKKRKVSNEETELVWKKLKQHKDDYKEMFKKDDIGMGFNKVPRATKRKHHW